VYAPSKDGRVYCLDAGNGSVQWDPLVQAGVSSPALDGGVLYVGGGAFGGVGHLVALNASTGATIWSYVPNGPVQASVTRAGGAVLFSTNAPNGTIYALDASTGAVLWNFTPSPAQYILSSPVAADGRMFAASDNGHLYAFAAPSSLLDLAIAGPDTLRVSANSTFNITLRAARGAISDVKVQLHLSNATAVAASGEGIVLDGTFPGEYVLWTLDDLAFGGSVVLTAQVEGYCVTGNASCVGATFAQTVSVTYSDFYGGLQPAVTQTTNVTIAGTSPSNSAGVSLLVPALLAVAVVAAAVVLLLVRLRRSRGGS
jgi:hypothetical protein